MSDEGSKAGRRLIAGPLGSPTGRIDRRTAFGGIAAAGAVLAGTLGGHGSAGSTRRFGRGQPVPGTPAGTATPTGLAIVREQRPRYSEAPRRGGVLRLLRPPATRDDFSPASFRQDFQITVSYLDPLLRPDAVTLEPRPWLAERWRWDEAERTITYELRDDARWHDGSPLAAADVRFSFLVYRDDPESGARAFFSGMEEVEALDERTVRVRLAQTDGGWLFNASTQPIFQAAQYERFWAGQPSDQRTLAGFEWADSLPLGTGPWRLAAWDQDRVEFERNEEYWAGAPAFARMTVAWEPNAAERLDAWRRGGVDVLWPVTADDVAEVEDIPGRLFVADGASVMYAAFNFFNPLRPEPGIFADVRVRRALNLAIDRARYAESVFGSFIRQRAAGTVAQPWANASDVTNPLRDVDQAAALLAEVGWVDYDLDGVLDDGFGQRFAISVIVQKGSRQELGDVLDSVRRDLGQVGVELTVEELPEAEFRARWLTTRDYDLIAFAYDQSPGFTDFDLYGSAWDVRTNPRGFNPGGYSNPDADAAIADALGSVEVGKQREALRQLQVAVDDDLFGLWFGFPRDLILVAPDVLGFQPNKLWATAETAKLWRSTGKGSATPVAATPTEG